MCNVTELIVCPETVKPPFVETKDGLTRIEIKKLLHQFQLFDNVSSAAQFINTP